MPRRSKVPDRLRETVRERAGYLCEYCHALEAWQYVEFTMEHFAPVAEGGESTLENLALACFGCNRRKWDRRTGIDPETGDEHNLYNPRVDNWSDHFAWSADSLEIVGLTPKGRATANTLELNRDRIKQIRAADLQAGRHPPKNDRRQ